MGKLKKAFCLPLDANSSVAEIGFVKPANGQEAHINIAFRDCGIFCRDDVPDVVSRLEKSIPARTGTVIRDDEKAGLTHATLYPSQGYMNALTVMNTVRTLYKNAAVGASAAFQIGKHFDCRVSVESLDRWRHEANHEWESGVGRCRL